MVQYHSEISLKVTLSKVEIIKINWKFSNRSTILHFPTSIYIRFGE